MKKWIGRKRGKDWKKNIMKEKNVSDLSTN
jgi:hypothetical protein